MDPPFSLCLKWQFHRFLLWELIFGRPGVRGSTPLKWQFHRFLLWEFIFSRPGLGRSTHLCLSQMTISQIPSLRAHVWQARSWWIYPVPHRDFTDSYSKSSYFADQVLGDLPPQMAISQIIYLRAHIWQTRSLQIFLPATKQWFHRFLLWELIFGRPGLGRSTSPLEFSFYRFLLWELICGRPGFRRYTPSIGNVTDSYSESSYLADQVLVDLPPSNVNFQIPTQWAHILADQVWTYLPQSPTVIFTDSYSERSCLADQVLGELPHSNGNFTDSYSENSFLTDQVLVDLSSQMAMSKIPTLRTHIWESRSWHIFHPPPNSDFTDSYSENSFLTDQVLVDPPLSVCLKWKFHRFLLWELIFGRLGLRRSTLSYGNFTDSYSEGSYLADQVLVDPPPPYLSQMKISQIPTLRTHIWETRSWHIFHSPTKQWFNRFLLWEFIFGRPGLGRSISQLSAHFTDSYSESSYLDNQVLVDPPFSPYLKWQFHRFLLWELIFVRPGLGRSPPLSVSQMTISQIATLRAYVWQARSWWIYPRLTQGFHRFLL